MLHHAARYIKEYKLIIIPDDIVHHEDRIVAKKALVKFYNGSTYYNTEIKVNNISLPTSDLSIGSLIHILDNHKFKRVSYIQTLEYIVTPDKNDNIFEWTKYMDKYLIDNKSYMGRGFNNKECPSNIRIRYELPEGHWDRRMLSPVEMGVCSDCGGQRCKYTMCHNCGNQTGIPLWIGLFNSWDDDSIQCWNLQYDKYTPQTVRKKVRDFIRKKKLKVVSGRNRPYNGIFILSPNTIVNNMQTVLLGAVNKRRLLASS